MASPFELIVGLGNPGTDYESTRHNAGVWLLKLLINKYGINLKLESKFYGNLASFQPANTNSNLNIKIFIPNTYMNESGKAVAAISKFYKIAPEKIIIVHDDLDLQPGSIRLKKGGGHGGHNGLRDIIPALGNPNFARFRIGIGHPGDKRQVSNFVLKSPPKAEKEAIDFSLNISLDYLDDILLGKWDKAMNVLHSLPNS